MDVNHIVDSPFRALPRGDKDAVALSIDGDPAWTTASCAIGAIATSGCSPTPRSHQRRQGPA